MKKILVLMVAATFCYPVFAQNTKGTAPAAGKANAHLKVYDQAVVTGDFNTAIVALNYYLNEQGSNNVYADTLAMLYMQQGAYGQCYYWADKRLQSKPDDNGLLEMKGLCLEKMQAPKEAITVFEKLFSRTQSPYHAYKLMELQYSIKRLAECVATATAAERLQFKPEYVMSYNVGEQVGRTYLQAGIFNIHGLALFDLDRRAEAKAYFERAVALDSGFALARQNLEAIRAMEANPNKEGVKTNATPGASPANKN